MGKLPVEPVWTQWGIGENTNICQIQVDEIEIASRRNRIQEGYSAKTEQPRSVLRSVGNLGNRQDIVSATQRISRFTFQSKGFSQLITKGRMPARLLLKKSETHAVKSLDVF